MPEHDPRTPHQLNLFPQELLQRCDKRELRRLERTWNPDDFGHGWTTGAVEARLYGRP